MLLCIHALTNPMCMFQLVSSSEKRKGEIPSGFLFSQVEVDYIVGGDMQHIYTTLQIADALVFTSPIYWFTVSA